MCNNREQLTFEYYKALLHFSVMFFSANWNFFPRAVPWSCLRIVVRDPGSRLSKKGRMRKFCSSAKPCHPDTPDSIISFIHRAQIAVKHWSVQFACCPQTSSQRTRFWLPDVLPWPCRGERAGLATSEELHTCLLCPQGSEKGRGLSHWPRI